MAGPKLSVEEVAAFLRERHGMQVTALVPLGGGFWSTAYAYRADGRELVARFSELREGFEMDRAAVAFASAALPVPQVLEVGDAFGVAYAISERRHGRFLEDVAPAQAAPARLALGRLLAAFRSAPAQPAVGVSWYAAAVAPAPDWHRWLVAGLTDNPAHRVSGWRAVLAADARLDRLFRACEQRVDELLAYCPERRDLVHGDLLNRNVLVADDLSAVTAVFSWKCSVLGDFLFDVAWCTFWSPWHPGVAAMDLWDQLAATSPPEGSLQHADLRHHCYELQIAGSHLGWNAWTGDRDGLRALAQHTEQTLRRGPLPGPG